MNTFLFTGCATALVTPFLPNGQLDESALRRLLFMQTEADIDALVLLGTTGEPCTLSMDERRRIIEIGLECVGDSIPIIVGTGSNDTRRAIEYAHQAHKLGAAGQLCVTPYYNKATQVGLIRHYHAILDACPLPMILYNVPSRTGMGFSADTVAELSRHPGVAGLKEAGGNPVFTNEVLEKTHGELPVYCGNDDQILPLMALGSCGAISVVSNVLPERTRALTHACLERRMDDAQKLQLELSPLIRALFLQVSPIPVKAALAMMEIIHEELRLPLTPMEEPYRSRLKHVLTDIHLISS